MVRCLTSRLLHAVISSLQNKLGLIIDSRRWWKKILQRLHCSCEISTTIDAQDYLPAVIDQARKWNKNFYGYKK